MSNTLNLVITGNKSDGTSAAILTKAVVLTGEPAVILDAVEKFATVEIKGAAAISGSEIDAEAYFYVDGLNVYTTPSLKENLSLTSAEQIVLGIAEKIGFTGFSVDLKTA